MKSTFFNVNLVLVLFLFGGYVAIPIEYNKSKIEKRYLQNNYLITLNGKKVDFRNLYLDRKNVKSIQRNRKEKIISIEQRKETNLVGLKALESNTINFQEIELIIINGIVIKNMKQIKFEPKAVKNIQILKKEVLNKLFPCRDYKGDMLLITIE